MRNILDLHANDFQSETKVINRRSFLKGSVGAGVGLVIAMQLPLAKIARSQQSTNAAFSPNAFVRISLDNTVTVLIKHLEMGQGAFSGLATLAAEELDADWSQMRAEHAPANAELYKNNAFGIQGVGGSTGLANSYEQLRRAGASARAMLVAAAAQLWSLSAKDIKISKGRVSNTADQRSASFGELAELAAQQDMPSDITLKKPDAFTLIGTDLPKLDTQSKSTGKAVFTQDIVVDDMVYAVVAHPSKFGATLDSFNSENSLKMPGVIAVKQIPSGIAVIAKSTYQAIQARDALEIKWNEDNAEKRSSEQLYEAFSKATDSTGLTAYESGKAEEKLSASDNVKEVVFEFPYLAHAPMETLDAVVRANKNGSVDVWMGSQLQTVDQGTIAGVFGISPAKVNLMTQLAGGSFGRRAQPDSGFAAEAAHVAKAIDKGTPVKLMWTRKDDIQGGRYRPMTVHRIKAALDENRDIAALHHAIATQSIIAGSPFEQMIQNGIDPTSIEGATEIAYDIKDRKVLLHNTQSAVPVLWWRAVGHTHTAYALDVMLDYLIDSAGKDPIKERMALLKDSPRDLGVLKQVAKMADASGPVAQGSARGAAVHKSFGSYVAQIAEVTRTNDNMPKVTKVWCAIDCGIAVNPNVIKAQIEGGIGFGISSVLFEEIVLDEGGSLSQDNFDGYKTMRMQDMPSIETFIMPSDQAPTGVGEPGTPPIGPAIANAWRRLTGQMVTRLPFAVGTKKQSNA